MNNSTPTSSEGIGAWLSWPAKPSFKRCRLNGVCGAPAAIT